MLQEQQADEVSIQYFAFKIGIHCMKTLKIENGLF